MKLCKNCKYFAQTMTTEWCCRPGLDLVYGNGGEMCRHERSLGDCGPEGKFFVQATPKKSWLCRLFGR